MAGIDEISEKLGSISSDVKHLITKSNIIDAKVEVTQNQTIELRAAAKAAHKRIDGIEPKVNNHEALKNRGMGIVSILALIFGFVGTILGKFLHF